MGYRKILVIGASGYVGSRLVYVLLQKGYQVRAAGRSLERMRQRIWASHSKVELLQLDVFDQDQLLSACAGCQVVFYLVHSMNPTHKDFADADRLAAENMAKTAKATGVRRIIYLGGLGDLQHDLSRHLQSRLEVAEILHSGKVPVTTLRAAMIIGTASVSFEILRYLVLRLPVMITPRWVSTESQPIAISNVLNYLIDCLEHDQTSGQTYDIGGPDIVTYRKLMEIYIEEAQLMKRMIIPIPILTPRLSSYWIHLVTPISSSLAMPLAEGLRNRVVCQNDHIIDIIPQNLLSCREAIRNSLNNDLTGFNGKRLESFIPEGKIPGDPAWAGGQNEKK